MTFEQAQKLNGNVLSDDNGLLVIHVRCEQRAEERQRDHSTTS
jgi:antirestriction protein ArdC